MGVDMDEGPAITQAETVAGLPHAANSVRVSTFHDFVDDPQGGSVSQVASVRGAQEVLETTGLK